MKFKKGIFSRKDKKALSKSEIQKAHDKALIRVIKDERRTIERLKRDPLALIFAWFKNRREVKKI